jgi:hypothetical protein
MRLSDRANDRLEAAAPAFTDILTVAGVAGRPLPAS